MKRIARILRLHFALWLGLAVMAAASAVSPVVWGWPMRLAVAWDAGIAAAMIVLGLGALYWRTHRFDGAFREAGAVHGVDPELLRDPTPQRA